jgi:hypothetical protein
MIGGAETLASKLALLPQQATTVVECPVSLLRGSLLKPVNATTVLAILLQ